MAVKGVNGVALITEVSASSQAIYFIPPRAHFAYIWAAAGIGREAAFAFAEAGATGIILADMNDNGVREAAEQSETVAVQEAYRYLVVHLNVTDPASVQFMIDAAVRTSALSTTVSIAWG